MNCDFTWNVHVHDHLLDRTRVASLREIPDHLDVQAFQSLVNLLDTLYLCRGNADVRYVEMLEHKRDNVIFSSGSVVAYLDNKLKHQKTVRHHSCSLLVMNEKTKCHACWSYRDNLRAIYSNFCKSKEFSKKTNFRYLSSPQKNRRLKLVRNALKNKQRQLNNLRKKLKAVTEKQGVIVSDLALQADIEKVIAKHGQDISKLPADNFRRIFWEQQVHYLIKLANELSKIILY